MKPMNSGRTLVNILIKILDKTETENIELLQETYSRKMQKKNFDRLKTLVDLGELKPE